MPQLQRGILIAIEGIDGSGKTTLINNLADRFAQLNLPVLKTREPGASKLGKALRELLQHRTYDIFPVAEFLLFAADRAQHMQEIILPALQAHTIVISDRMSDSSLVYQGYGKGVDLEMINSVNRWAMHNKKPDLTCFVHIEQQLAKKRLHERAQKLTAFEKESNDFTQKLIAGFETLYKNREDVIFLEGSDAPESIAHNAFTQIKTFLVNNRLLTL
ncbi:MAG: Thymidylate kinase [Candidatus Dependentiae bacterium ADurb.Bin331]|nr:MAG: Thymidylate kinase [Candidatus Dependentiae bacterium ADurb.Bin331]